MKSFLFSIILMAVIALSACSVNAQAPLVDFDTITNTGTAVVTVDNTTDRNVAVQVIVTKVSGTVAGTCVCQASLDGTNFATISTDTLTLSNVTAQSKIWTVGEWGNIYKDYRASCTGSGTMAAVIKINRRSSK